MKALAKIGVISAGYVAAAVLASAVVAHSPNRNDPSGMAAAGDAMLFVAVFSVVAALPTGLALYYLRPVRWFWTALGVAAVALAAIGLIAAVVFAAATPPADPRNPRFAWVDVAVLWLLASPVLAGAFALCGLVAPARRQRWTLLSAAAAEGAVTAFYVLRMVMSQHRGFA